MPKYLIVNTGSASKKYALYSENQEIFKAHLETEDGGLVSTIKLGTTEKKETITQENYDNSVIYIIELLLSNKLITGIDDIKAIGLRIVAPGIFFLADKIIDDEYLSKLQEAKNRAPLHIEPELAEIEHLQKTMPNTPIVGISDSAFHKTMPDKSKLYGLPQDIASRFEMYRYGYHGISAQSIVNKIKNWIGDIPPKTIICHLGSGSSIVALKNGQSIDTTMGFTPLEGIIMSTRVGNIDAGAVIYLAQNLGLDLNNLEAFLNQKCGLLGISGQTSDIRELLKLEAGGDKKAATALEIFVYHVKKYIGAYAAALGGLDLLVFTATIGERSFIMRSRICRELSSLGIILDEDKNNATVSSDSFINKGEGYVKIAVITTDEMGEMARQVQIKIS